MKIYGCFINGRHEFNDSNNIISVINPYDEKIKYKVEESNFSQIESALEFGYKSFKSGVWSKLDVRERSEVLNNTATLIDKNIEELIKIEVNQIGRPIREMRAQLGRLSEWFKYFASLIRVFEGSVTPFKGDYINYVERVPLGLVVQITPWNHPLLISIKKLSCALAAGNSVVLKPSELSPVSILRIADFLNESGLPKGVFNIVQGYGSKIGEKLCVNNYVSKIDLTGGDKAGKIIGEHAGKNGIYYSTELGGKSPMLVFEDCEIEKAVSGITFGCFIASGQTCIAGTRLLIQKSISEKFLSSLKKKMLSLKIGDPYSLETNIGPVISRDSLLRIDNKIKEAVKEGGEIIVGGKIHTKIKSGFFYEPTVIMTKNIANIAQEELFGPVLSCIIFDTEEDAIRLANDTKYGLAASIWTENLARGHSVASKLDCGIIWINDHHKNDPSSPWGGFKDSGIGRENGYEAYMQYTHTRSIIANYSRKYDDWFSDQASRYS